MKNLGPKLAIAALVTTFAYLKFDETRDQINLVPGAGDTSFWPYVILLAAVFIWWTNRK